MYVTKRSRIYKVTSVRAVHYDTYHRFEPKLKCDIELISVRIKIHFSEYRIPIYGVIVDCMRFAVCCVCARAFIRAAYNIVTESYTCLLIVGMFALRIYVSRYVSSRCFSFGLAL